MSNQSSADEIAKLHELLKDGIISRQEFETVKRRIIEQGTQPYRSQTRTSTQSNPMPRKPVETNKEPRKASTVFLICGVVLAVFFMASRFDDTGENLSRVERTPIPTAAEDTDQMSISLSNNDGNGEDETIYTDGVIGVLVTIPDDANWVVDGEGCRGIGSGIVGDLHAGQLAAVTPINSTTSRNVSFLSKGLVVDDGSCQFAFEADMFEADEYEITIWEASVVCERTDMLESSTGVIGEVLVNENGLTCRNVNS